MIPSTTVLLGLHALRSGPLLRSMVVVPVSAESVWMSWMNRLNWRSDEAASSAVIRPSSTIMFAGRAAMVSRSTFRSPSSPSSSRIRNADR